MMGVGIKVDFLWFPLGNGDFVHSFFSTVCYNLENGAWGSRFPCLMNCLYQGEISHENVDELRDELLIIQKEFLTLSTEKIIWDIEDLSKQPPWGEDISPKITSLSNYFVTSDGEDLFNEMFKAIHESQAEKQSIILESL